MNEDYTCELGENASREKKSADEHVQSLSDGVGNGAGKTYMEDSELSSDPAPDSGSDPGTALSGAGGHELRELRDELNQLKAALIERDEKNARIRREYDEFRTLYPDVALNSLSDALWRDVESGIPLAAAYALAERRHAYEAEIARMSNADTKNRSAGSVKGGAEGEFSPSEVRAMSQSDVRKNFSKIMRSMQKWR